MLVSRGVGFIVLLRNHSPTQYTAPYSNSNTNLFAISWVLFLRWCRSSSPKIQIPWIRFLLERKHVCSTNNNLFLKKTNLEVGHWYSYFDLLLTSALGFKARADPCTYMFHCLRTMNSSDSPLRQNLSTRWQQTILSDQPKLTLSQNVWNDGLWEFFSLFQMCRKNKNLHQLFNGTFLIVGRSNLRGDVSIFICI